MSTARILAAQWRRGRVGNASIAAAVLLAAVFVGCAVRQVGVQSGDASLRQADAPTPEDSGEQKAATVKSNDPCYICHMPFLEEPLAQVHAKAKVWCATCHGPSVAHMADERIGATPADVAYGKAQIDAMCGKCHEPDDHPEVDEEARSARLAEGQKAQEAIKDRKIEATAVCTDCHGQHWIPELD